MGGNPILVRSCTDGTHSRSTTSICRRYALNDPTPITLQDAVDFRRYFAADAAGAPAPDVFCNSGPAVLALSSKKSPGSSLKTMCGTFFIPLRMDTRSYFLIRCGTASDEAVSLRTALHRIPTGTLAIGPRVPVNASAKRWRTMSVLFAAAASTGRNCFSRLH